MDQSSSYYDILEITQQASDFEIKDAYRRLAFQYHPDRNPFNRAPAELRFRLINEAYSHLKTREKRQRYNHSLRKQGVRRPGNAQNDNGFFAQLAAFFTGRNTNSGA
ncbi:MAG: DnaJ domain-containing protein [Alphaproteobacteria bacterium]